MSAKIPDNFLLGMLCGTVVLCGGAAAVEKIRNGFADIPRYWTAPKPELVVLLLNIFLFRMLMLKAGYERTGRGVLFATIVLVMIYYFGRMKSVTA
jgi:hypothetical protein